MVNRRDDELMDDVWDDGLDDGVDVDFNDGVEDDFYTETGGLSLEGLYEEEPEELGMYEDDELTTRRAYRSGKKVKSNKSNPTLDLDADDEDDEEYDEDVVYDAPKKRKGKGKGKWTAIIVLLLSLFLVGGVYLFRSAATNFGKVEQKSINDTISEVNDLFGDDGKIIAKLDKGVWDIARQRVELLEDSPQKVKLRTQIGEAENQLKSQTDAESLVNALLLNGQPFVDIHLNSFPERVEKFPTNFNTEYARELQDLYNTTYDAIKSVKDAERAFYLAVDSPDLTLAVLETYRSSIEGLVDSKTKTTMATTFNKLAKELEVKEAELAKKQAEELALQQAQQAEAQRLEQERIAREQQEAYNAQLQQQQEQERINKIIEEERQRLQAQWEAEQAARDAENNVVTPEVVQPTEPVVEVVPPSE